MSDLRALQTLDAVVNKILHLIPENQRTITQKRRFLEFAIDGLRELRLLTTRDGKQTVKVTPDVNNRIPYPIDCEEIVGIGIPHNGKLWYLTRRGDMITTKTVVGIDESLDSEDGEGVDLPVEQTETIFSEGGVNFAGYYTFDDREREIVINNPSRTELLLEYISSGVDASSTTYVPNKYIAALTAFVLWQDILADRTVSENTKFAYEKRYIDRKREIKHIEAPSQQEITDAWTSGNGML